MIANKINESSEEMEADPKGAGGGSIFCAYPNTMKQEKNYLILLKLISTLETLNG